MSQAVVVGLVLGWISLATTFFLAVQLRRWWRRRRYGDPIDHNSLLMEYGRRMTSTFDRTTLTELLQTELPRPLGADRSLLLLPKGHQLVATGGEMLRLPVSDAAVRRVAAAGAAAIDGTIMASILDPAKAGQNHFRLGHPGGIFEGEADIQKTGQGHKYVEARFGRTARRLMEGYVLVPESAFG